MISFKVLKKSKKSRARLGILKTPNGEVETPAFVPVATQAVVKTLTSEEAATAGSQLLICNTFHLHLKPGEKLVKKAGGLHEMMNWSRPLMTDSGGFQVFSLGFGRDHGVGKILQEEKDKSIFHGNQPREIKITEEGVHFRSPLDGAPLFLGPKESIRIQEQLGADIILAFDECPSPLANKDYMRASLDKTHRWAVQCLKARRSTQALYGIVQGGAFRDLREESARVIGAMDFDGFGIGGEFGYDKRSLQRTVGWATDLLPENKPRHLLGVGHAEDFSYIMASGADTFDCIAPTQYARHGMVFTSAGRINLRRRALLNDKKPLDPKCGCPVCAAYSRGYVVHLVRSGEITGLKLASLHNLYYFNALAAELRRKIKNNEL
ncbi:MAG: tRNA guanosine(34) transglycosylase Tgt [Candidatus Niyogibacteria bacterium]|nr:tRNA guanosine(34) transglycosylase Tgt [Candidatus Niyogibacteria bacterium]